MNDAPTKSFHQKFHWQAQDFFDDRLVIDLCKAIEDDDIAEMERLIKLGANVNEKGQGGMTLLMWAFPDDKLERFKKLLEHGADPNVRITTNLGVPSGFMVGDSVTTLSAETRFPGYFEAVMEAGGDPNLEDGFGKSVLHVIILSMLPDAKHRAQIALDHGADINKLYGGMTPTIAAVSTAAQFDLAVYFLERGADPDVFMENQFQQLVHCVVMREKDIPQFSPAKLAEYKRLKNWLAKDGKDFDLARADVKRWEQFPLWDPKKTAAMTRAEIAKRKAREAAEKD